jgi:hypothetical protein
MNEAAVVSEFTSLFHFDIQLSVNIAWKVYYEVSS